MIVNLFKHRTMNSNIKKYSYLTSLLKIGFIGFGGGNAIIPVIEQEVVREDKLVSKEEYDEDVIISSITPGALTVKISAAVGGRIMGSKGMVLAALLMAFPGFIGTIILISVLSTLNKSILKQVEFISIGITAFILSSLFQYIKETVKKRKKSNKIISAGVIIVTVFLLSCGKNVYKLLEVNRTPIFSISSINILIIVFFIIFYTKCKFKPLNVAVCFTVSGVYLLCVGTSNIIGNSYIYRFMQIVMIIFSFYGITSDVHKKRLTKKVSIKPLVAEMATWIIFGVVMILPAVIVFPGVFKFLWRAILSCIISFGGGDAYLTTADGMFISSGMISHKEFYGQLVLIANVLPGSIMCKVLSGIGYYIGYKVSKSVVIGYLVAFAGFVCSVVASCGIFCLVKYEFEKFEEIKAFKILKAWISTIISGLLANVMLSLISQCMNVGMSYGRGHGLILFELITLYFLNDYLVNRRNVSMGIRILMLIATSTLISNAIM